MLKIIKLISLFILLTVSANAGEKIKIYTADLPPWSISGGKGIFTDILKILEKKVPYNFEIIEVPWSRALMMVNRHPKNLIYPITRTRNRENKYNWVLSIMPIEISFISINGKIIDIKKARTLNSIIVHKDAPPYNILKAKNFNNLVSVPWGGERPALMLLKGRGEVWFSGVAIAKYSALKLGFRDRITVGPAVIKSHLYVAASTIFPKDKKKVIRKAYNKLVKSGVVKKIISSYLNTPKISQTSINK